MLLMSTISSIKLFIQKNSRRELEEMFVHLCMICRQGQQEIEALSGREEAVRAELIQDKQDALEELEHHFLLEYEEVEKENDALTVENLNLQKKVESLEKRRDERNAEKDRLNRERRAALEEDDDGYSFFTKTS